MITTLADRVISLNRNWSHHMLPMRMPTLSILILCVCTVTGCDQQTDVPAKDITISHGPDGEIIYLPANDSMSVSALAQYLQLNADFAGISKDGYFLDTQVANLHQQEDILGRAVHYGWTWHNTDGTLIDIPAALAEVKKKIKRLDVVG